MTTKGSVCIFAPIYAAVSELTSGEAAWRPVQREESSTPLLRPRSPLNPSLSPPRATRRTRAARRAAQPRRAGHRTAHRTAPHSPGRSRSTLSMPFSIVRLRRRRRRCAEEFGDCRRWGARLPRAALALSRRRGGGGRLARLPRCCARAKVVLGRSLCPFSPLAFRRRTYRLRGGSVREWRGRWRGKWGGRWCGQWRRRDRWRRRCGC